eukprot:scaffold189956_cov43-Prasinocladus_malaysianus.AAC.4
MPTYCVDSHKMIVNLSLHVFLQLVASCPEGPQQGADNVVSRNEAKHQSPRVRRVQDEAVHWSGKQAGKRGQSVAHAKDRARVFGGNVKVRGANPAQRQSTHPEPNGDD